MPASLPYGVVAVPDEIAPNYTTTSYNGAPIGGIRGGAYWVNTFVGPSLYELPALTARAVPGHHHQDTIAREMEDLPDFRKQLYFPAMGEAGVCMRKSWALKWASTIMPTNILADSAMRCGAPVAW